MELVQVAAVAPASNAVTAPSRLLMLGVVVVEVLLPLELLLAVLLLVLETVAGSGCSSCHERPHGQKLRLSVALGLARVQPTCREITARDA